jgi:hypothetical protein
MAPIMRSIRWPMARAANGAARMPMPACPPVQGGRYAAHRLGSHVICEDRRLIFEEAPDAYKDIGMVIADLEQAGLIRVIAKLRPLLSYKTRAA